VLLVAIPEPSYGVVVRPELVDDSAMNHARSIVLVSLAAALGAGCSSTPAASGGAPGMGSSGAPGSGSAGQAGSGGAVELGTPLSPGDPGSADVRIEIRSDSDVHPISPLIYGTAQPDNVSQTRFTLLRSGGNRMTAYNWETNASNAGSDYMFQNDDNLSKSNTPGDALQSTLSGAKSVGGTALLTIPIVDYVAADKNGGGDVRNSGSDYLQTRFKQNRATKGSDLSTTPDASDDYVNEDEFVNWVKTVGAANGPSVVFALDNEPDLWSKTHAEIHPDAVTYDELCQRDATYATMVKTVWPEAKVTGFVSYGYNGYVSLQNAPDDSKGDFIEYYLDQMKAAEAAAGHRVVDYLDLHWYPEAQGGGKRITGTDTSADMVTARVQAPRSLWDSSYSESSWIVNDALKEPIHLITRVNDKIAAHYPGTGLAITEWNYGGGQDISGAVAVADVLGIFGSYGVAIGSYWKLGNNETFANAAFRAYRNFDGAGAAFGDTSIHASSSDVPTATVYASVDSATPDRVVTVLINKATSDKTAAITIAHPSSFANLSVYTLTSSGANLVSGSAVPAVAPNAFLYTMPALSVSVLVANTAH
jgi:hypothetical protein